MWVGCSRVAGIREYGIHRELLTKLCRAFTRARQSSSEDFGCTYVNHMCKLNASKHRFRLLRIPPREYRRNIERCGVLQIKHIDDPRLLGRYRAQQVGVFQRRIWSPRSEILLTPEMAIHFRRGDPRKTPWSAYASERVFIPLGEEPHGDFEGSRCRLSLNCLRLINLLRNVAELWVQGGAFSRELISSRQLSITCLLYGALPLFDFKDDFDMSLKRSDEFKTRRLKHYRMFEMK